MPENDSQIQVSAVEAVQPAHFIPVHWTLDCASQQFSQYAEQPAGALMSAMLAYTHLEQWLELLEPETRLQVEQLVENVCRSGDRRSLNAVMRISPDHAVYVVFSAERLSKQIIQGEIRPIFELTQVQQATHWLAALLNHSSSGVLITTSEHRVLGCNAAFEHITGFQQSDLLGLSSSWLFEGDIEDSEIGACSAMTIQHASGLPQTYQCQSIRLQDSNEPAVILSLFSLAEEPVRAVPDDIADKSAFITQLENLYQSRLVNELYVVMALCPQQVSHSQLMGLLDVMRRLKENRLLGRIKDDLYLLCVSCPTPASGEPFRYIHAQIRRFFQELKQSSAEIHRICTQGKIGVSILGLDARNAKMAVTHSVQATLEQGVEKGPQRLRFFDTQLHRQIKRRRLLEELVSDTIHNQSLLVEYQPILESRTGQVMSYEALCRFPLPPGLDVSNSELVGIAEDLGLVTELDLLVQQQALRQWSTLQARHESPVWLTMNISPNTRQGLPDLIACLCQLISDEKVPADRIIIDITQSNIHFQAIAQSSQLKMLRQLGVQVAIDDFDLDYALFNHLSSIDIDYLKISRSCIAGMGNRNAVYKVIKMLVELCHSLGVKVIAEGVESEDEAQLLTFGNLDYLQGFYFAAPMSIEALAEHEENMAQRIIPLAPQEDMVPASSLMSLHHAHSPHLDSSDPVSLAYQYFQSPDVEVLPIIVDHECVGILDRARLNLHLTPGMGSELETMKEASMWHRPVNQIMELAFTRVDASTDVSKIAHLIRDHHLTFPWILTQGKVFKGILTQNSVLQYLTEHPDTPEYMI